MVRAALSSDSLSHSLPCGLDDASNSPQEQPLISRVDRLIKRLTKDH